MLQTKLQSKQNSSQKTNKKTLTQLAKTSNQKAAISFTIWLVIIIIFWTTYFSLNLNQIWIYSFTIFTIFLDSFFMTIWCPFRDLILKNKCCNTCRIYIWGAWMVFLPLLAIKSFYTYSTVIISITRFITWEYQHHRHPERFYEISNTNLTWKNCKTPRGFCGKRNNR